MWNKKDKHLTTDSSSLDPRIDALEALEAKGTEQTATLSHGLNVVSSDRATPAKWDFEGRHVVNLVPSFDSGLWHLHTNATKSSSRKVVITTPSGVGRDTSDIKINAKGNTTYTFSLNATNIDYSIQQNDSSGSEIGSRLVGYISSKSVTFTTDSNAVQLLLRIGNSVNSTSLASFEDITLVEGSTAKEYVQGIKPVVNPIVKNSGKNMIDYKNFLNTSAPYKQESNGFISLDNFANSSATIEVDFIKQQEYTISALGYVDSSSGNTKALVMRFIDANGNSTSTSGYNALNFNTDTSPTTRTRTVTAPADAVKLAVYVLSQNTGKIFIKDVMLVAGDASNLPQSFEPHNPSYQVIKSSFYGDGTVNDTAYQDANGQWWKNKKWEHVVLDGSYDYSVNQDYTGYKRIRTAIDSNSKDSVGQLVEDNGIVLRQTGLADTVGTFNVYGGYVYINLEDSKTGWGETYTPTVQEMKDYLSSHPLNLLYQLKTPIQEQIESEGELQLHEGLNQVEVSEGVVVKEKAHPYYASNYNAYYINHDTMVEDQSEEKGAGMLSSPVKTIVSLYENNKLKKFTTFYATTNVMGIKISESDFDTDATYYVTYIAMDYETAYNKNSSIEYVRSLRDSHDELVDRVIDHGEQISMDKWAIVELYAKLKAYREGGN
ncbi:hypothetical protein Q7A53_06060 [Halobacillus rhizosphaerae]|uniref:hypothetical protein n=1 Tax=Halobacillus rhizosphaerae TaxID=3064889 RepID=UPI00398ADEE8